MPKFPVGKGYWLIVRGLEHGRPHAHLFRGSEDIAALDLADGRLLAGNPSGRELRAARAAIEVHRAAMMDAWHRFN